MPTEFEKAIEERVNLSSPSAILQ